MPTLILNKLILSSVKVYYITIKLISNQANKIATTAPINVLIILTISLVIHSKFSCKVAPITLSNFVAIKAAIIH